MKVVGRGLVDKIAEKIKMQLGTVKKIKYDSELQMFVVEVEMDSGQQIKLPYKAGAREGARVIVEANDFFILT